jgi:putative ATP-binding cassette transporter
MLDEASSALDHANEERVYRQFAQAAITPVSVSHRASLLPYHRRVLELAGDGTWAVHDAGRYHFD